MTHILLLLVMAATDIVVGWTAHLQESLSLQSYADLGYSKSPGALLTGMQLSNSGIVAVQSHQAANRTAEVFNDIVPLRPAWAPGAAGENNLWCTAAMLGVPFPTGTSWSPPHRQRSAVQLGVQNRIS
jgi:hypothetical protein